MQKDFTEGPITSSLLRFSFPLMLGNLLQQCYNVADTWVVGRYLGSEALAAVGSSYTLMTFLTSILLGLCMGSGAVFSMQYGRRDMERLKNSLFLSFTFIAAVTVLLNVAVFLGLDLIVAALQVPNEVVPRMKEYLLIIFIGISATFLYNYFASLLRAVGNSIVPLVFLGIASVLNVGLDLLFVLVFPWGVQGAAAATVIAQFVSGFGMAGYVLLRVPSLRPAKRHLRWDAGIVREIASLSFLTSVQQSIMNFGILLIQGLVNSFGTVVMAAFAAAVKINSFAHMPAQDFGNAFSTFIAQNYGAGRHDRIQKGVKSAVLTALVFCVTISAFVCIFARPLIGLFVQPGETDILAVGVQYLRIEGSCYFGIGLLALLYGYYRAIHRPGISVVLTVISLGTRVLLAYLLSSIPAIGVVGIWVSVPIGWLLADLTGVLYQRKLRRIPPQI